MTRKIEYTIVGLAFVLLNCYAVTHGHTLFGMFFGITAAILLIQAKWFK